MGACRPGGQHWDYYPGASSLIIVKSLQLRWKLCRQEWEGTKIVHATMPADYTPHQILSPSILESFFQVQWNLSVTTTPMIKFIRCDLFSNVF